MEASEPILVTVRNLAMILENEGVAELHLTRTSDHKWDAVARMQPELGQITITITKVDAVRVGEETES